MVDTVELLQSALQPCVANSRHYSCMKMMQGLIGLICQVHIFMKCCRSPIVGTHRLFVQLKETMK